MKLDKLVIGIALSMLREGGKYLAPELLASLRGQIWLESGDSEIAVLFLERASELSPPCFASHTHDE